MELLPLYDIWRLIEYPRDFNESEIRGTCRSIYLGDTTVLCRVLGRYKMFVDTRDIGISSHLMLEGYWEMWVTEAMLRCVRRGSTVIDVGANLGYFTILTADLTGPEGRVLAFEPNPALVERARNSIEVNGFSGFVTLHDCALGEAEGRVTLDFIPQHPGGGRVHEQGDAANPNTSAVTFPVRRLDSFPEALDAEFIKIDVEGFEQHVWRGMTGIFDRGHPLTIFMEFTVVRYEDPRGFLAEIADEGFSLEIIDYRDGIQPITVEEIMARPHSIDHMLVFRRDRMPPPGAAAEAAA